MSWEFEDEDELRASEELLYTLEESDYRAIEKLASKLYIDKNSPTKDNRFRSTIQATLMHLIEKAPDDEFVWSH